MYDLKSIQEQNKRAEELGIMKAGEAVGTTGFVPQTKGHSEDQGGLRGHSIGETYPWQVQPRVNDSGVTVWVGTNALTSYETTRYDTYEQAERVAEAYRSTYGAESPPVTTTLHTEDE